MVKLTHQQGHIAAALYATGDFTLFEREALVFHVSGGTTDLLCNEAESITPLGTSSDLYAGRPWTALASSWAFRSRRASMSASRPLYAPRKSPKVSVKGLTCSLSGLENQCAKLLAEGHDAPTSANTAYSAWVRHWCGWRTTLWQSARACRSCLRAA